jgi:predicted metalloendopeptidase
VCVCVCACVCVLVCVCFCVCVCAAKDWWSNETETNYQERSACLIDLFSTYQVGDRYVDGNLTIGENSADLGGIKFSYAAYEASQNRTVGDLSNLAPAVHGKEGAFQDRRIFFTSYAQTWCEDVRKVQTHTHTHTHTYTYTHTHTHTHTHTQQEAAAKAVLTDEHAPSKYRVIGPLSQFAPFAHAFQCASGSRMAPEQRCSLW